MAETLLLASVQSFLEGADLTPAPDQIGAAEPAAANDLPAIVLSLEETDRPGSGLGERSALITGALPWEASIDLANPFLPEEPTFPLLNDSRTILILPHGGLVRSDGSDPGTSPLTATDTTVTVNGAPRTVVVGNPGPGEVRALGTGILTFGAALPANGTVVVTYFLGQWEQRLELIHGVMRVDTCAMTPSDVRQLSDGVVAALLSPGARTQIVRLHALSVRSISSVGAPQQGGGPAFRRRTVRFGFRFEAEINRPDSSGGIIRQIPITSQLGDGQRPPEVLADSTETFTLPA